MTTEPLDLHEHRARILDAGDAHDREFLERLRADPCIHIVDNLAQQKRSLDALIPPPAADLVSEPIRWAYYPWRRTVVSILGPLAFRRVRLDRNRHLIPTAEQQRLAALRVGVIGLSVGHAAAYTIAAQGLCGALRLADYDSLELTNLNRVPATVFDIGLNKAVAAARRIAELDPYLHVEVLTNGLAPESVGEFLDEVDVVVEECDSLDIKALVREGARARRLPVVMATADRGLIDVERFDIEPDRAIFHGLLGDVAAADLADLSSAEKIPYVLRLVDAASLSARGAASLIEIGHSLATWPQLAGDVVVGAGTVAEAVRRIGLGEHLPSGRTRIDVAAALRQLDAPVTEGCTSSTDGSAAEGTAVTQTTTAETIAGAAIRAPSGGNAQPWHVEIADASVTLRLDPEPTATMDVGLRASAVAMGAAVFNARIAAAAQGVLGSVTVNERSDGSPLSAVVSLGRGDHAHLSQLYEPMLERATNRHRGTAKPLDDATIAHLCSVADDEGARLALFTAPRDLQAFGRILGESDRIRYLTPHLHADMIRELRWPGDGSPDSGIDVRSLELDPGHWALIDILRRPDVMAELSAWDAGAALGDDTRARVAGSSALGVVCVRGRTLRDYMRGGSATEAVWIVAQMHGIAVQPISPVFLYAHDPAELAEVSPKYARELAELRSEFLELVGAQADESAVLPLRLFDAPSPTVRSRRRPLHTAGARTGSAPGELSWQ